MPVRVEQLCPTHGPMHYREACCWWDCVGFDGEGCDYRVTDEEIANA